MNHATSHGTSGRTAADHDRRRFLARTAVGAGVAASLLRPERAQAAPIFASFAAKLDSRGVAITNRFADGSRRVVVANMQSSLVTVRKTTDGSLVGHFDAGAGTFGATLDPMTGLVWLTQTSQSRVVAMDPANGATSFFGAGTVGTSCRGIVAGYGSVWVTNFDQATVTELDAKSGTVLKQFSVGTPYSSAAFGICLDDWGQPWIAMMGENSIIRVNPKSGTIEKRVTVAAAPRAVTYDGGFVWASTSVGHTLAKIGARDGTLVAETSVGLGCRDLTVVDKFVYVDCPDSTPFDVWEVDAISMQPTRQFQFPSAVGAHGIAYDGDGSLWVSSGGIEPPLCWKVTFQNITQL